MEDQQEELEKIVTKGISEIECENTDCEIRGDYYKCYLPQFRKCGLYLSWIARLDHHY